MSQKLEELLLRWEDQRRTGKSASVEDLCRDCPELREQLQVRIRALEKMNQVLDLKSVGTLPTNRRPRTRYDDLRPNSELVPGYRLEKRLGKGGFGEVWKAIGPGGFAVALKFVSLNGNLGAGELRSLEVIKTLHHPNLLATFGSWQTGGFLVIAMELADRTLLDRLHEAVAQGLQGIPGDELIRYMLEAAKGIDYLNQPDERLGDSTKAAIQHRDIKPQNILLMGGGIKIGDFGLLRILKTTVTEQNGSLTLAYAAPEFLSGHAARSSDQYSLAVTYCHLRGGRLPFTGHPGQVMDGHLKHPPDLSMIPEAERGPVARALEKEPTRRWSSCGEFIKHLCSKSSGPTRLAEVAQGAQRRFSARRLVIVGLAVILAGVLIWALSFQFGHTNNNDPIKGNQRIGQQVGENAIAEDASQQKTMPTEHPGPVRPIDLDSLVRSDLEKLAGTWTTERKEFRQGWGMISYSYTMTIKGDQMNFSSGGKRTLWRIKIDPGQNPKRLTKVSQDGKVQLEMTYDLLPDNKLRTDRDVWTRK